MIYLNPSILPQQDTAEAALIRANNKWLFFNSLWTHFLHLASWYLVITYLFDDSPTLADYYLYKGMILMFLYHFFVGFFGSFYLNFKIIRLKP